MKSGLITVILLAAVMMLGTACSPEVGSEAWCNSKYKQMREKPKDWTASDAAEYAKRCVFK
jgi:hypothetical protein